MIYRFIAARTITARIAVEAPTLEEAKRRMIARALAGLQDTDFTHREDEHIHFRGAFETWEGANAAGVDMVVEEDKPNHIGTFEGFISPQGVVYAPVINLTAFCREHQLSYCGMWLVAQGKQATHKGWTIHHPDCTIS